MIKKIAELLNISVRTYHIWKKKEGLPNNKHYRIVELVNNIFKDEIEIDIYLKYNVLPRYHTYIDLVSDFRNLVAYNEKNSYYKPDQELKEPEKFGRQCKKRKESDEKTYGVTLFHLETNNNDKIFWEYLTELIGLKEGKIDNFFKKHSNLKELIFKIFYGRSEYIEYYLNYNQIFSSNKINSPNLIKLYGTLNNNASVSLTQTIISLNYAQYKDIKLKLIEEIACNHFFPPLDRNTIVELVNHIHNLELSNEDTINIIENFYTCFNELLSQYLCTNDKKKINFLISLFTPDKIDTMNLKRFLLNT